MRTARLATAIAIAATGAGCSTSQLDGAVATTPVGTFADVGVPVTSFEDLRFATVIRQRFDFSCGSAALATLLRFHYGRPQTEQTAFRGMWAAGDRAQIRRLGFSLLDMKRYLSGIGIEADGYQVTLNEIRKSAIPGIALLNVAGYRHFVVVKGLSDTEVLIGDPSLGLRTMPIAQFSSAWNGIYFVFNTDLSMGRRAFNTGPQWARFARAPVGSTFLNPLSIQSLMLTAPAYREF